MVLVCKVSWFFVVVWIMVDVDLVWLFSVCIGWVGEIGVEGGFFDVILIIVFVFVNLIGGFVCWSVGFVMFLFGLGLGVVDLICIVGGMGLEGGFVCLFVFIIIIFLFIIVFV